MTKFEEYDDANPQLWAAFRRYAKLARRKGFKHYSARGIFEIIRWHTGVTCPGAFKINNNLQQYYALKLMRLYPEFEGFFRIRNKKN